MSVAAGLREPVGQSAGYSRHRADFYVDNEHPKRLWLRALDPQARQHLRRAVLPADCQPGVIAPPSGMLPINQPQLESLFEVLQHAPDPRARNTRFRIGAVLTLVALRLLAGRRDIAELARFARTLYPPQRRLLGLPRKAGAKAFYQVPTYSVFYQVLTRLDNEVFAALLHDWLQARAGTLPQALALDGKMIYDHLGLLTLAQHEDGASQAVAVCDQKEGTPRSELTVATKLLQGLPALDGRTITADPLHCQKPNARAIGEKGGDYLIQIHPDQRQPAGPARAGADLRLPSRAPFFAQTTIGHGRVEVRQLVTFALEPAAAGFPFARSVSVVRSEITVKKTGKTMTDARYTSPASSPRNAPGPVAATDPRALGRHRDPQPLAARCRVGRGCLPHAPRHHFGQPRAAAQRVVRPPARALPQRSHPEIQELLHSHPAAGFRIIRSR